MSIIKLTEKNIEAEHICCAFSDKKSIEGTQLKKAWLKTEFKNGYNFHKLDVKGKVMIEYVPIEHSWLPLNGSNFMVINCFWVSGQYKGKGYGKELLQQCIDDAQKHKMDGIVAISSDKKRPFISDPKFFLKHGFEIIDEAPPFFKLMGLKLNQSTKYPQIMDSAKMGSCPDNNGITAYYSNTCPFTEIYMNKFLRDYAAKRNVPLTIHKIESKEEGRKMPIPWIISSIFYKGEFVTLDMIFRHLDHYFE